MNRWEFNCYLTFELVIITCKQNCRMLILSISCIYVWVCGSTKYSKVLLQNLDCSRCTSHCETGVHNGGLNCSWTLASVLYFGNVSKFPQ